MVLNPGCLQWSKRSIPWLPLWENLANNPRIGWSIFTGPWLQCLFRRWQRHPHVFPSWTSLSWCWWYKRWIPMGLWWFMTLLYSYYHHFSWWNPNKTTVFHEFSSRFPAATSRRWPSSRRAWALTKCPRKPAAMWMMRLDISFDTSHILEYFMYMTYPNLSYVWYIMIWYIQI